jgi:hypothetical protein
MKKPLFYRLFGAGRVPPQLDSMLKLEGVVLSDEGLKSSVTYINFRRPGMRSGWLRRWMLGSITLTNTRLVALGGGKLLIDVPLTDERLSGLKFSLEDETTLLVQFDASLFHADWSGQIEYRFHTDLAPDFVARFG